MRLLVDVLAIKECAVDREVLWQTVEKLWQFYIYNVHARNTSHRGLYDLRIPSVDGILATDDISDAEPVRNADDRAKVSWILDAVEGKG